MKTLILKVVNKEVLDTNAIPQDIRDLMTYVQFTTLRSLLKACQNNIPWDEEGNYASGKNGFPKDYTVALRLMETQGGINIQCKIPSLGGLMGYILIYPNGDSYTNFDYNNYSNDGEAV